MKSTRPSSSPPPAAPAPCSPGASSATRTIAWPELGAEACARLEVKDFPVVVVNDCHGGDLYAEGRKKYAKA